MAPPAADVDVHNEAPIFNIPVKGSAPSTTASRLTGPMTYSGSLKPYDQFDITSVIGREFPNLQLSDILHDDTKIRDLAILGASISVPLPLSNLPAI